MISKRYLPSPTGCIMLLLQTALLAQPSSDDIRAQLRPVLEQAISNAGVPGLAVAVLRDGKPVYVDTLGVIDLASRRPVTADTLFELASVTKTFTATAVLQLAERGKLDLDAHPRKYLPDYHPTDERAERMTIRHILTHTSGIPDDKDPAFHAPEFDERALERFVRVTAARPLDFEPGAKFGYSNPGYCILGDLVAKVSGVSWERYVRCQILQPLGMKRSALLLPEVKRCEFAQPHVVDNEYATARSAVYPYNRKRAPASAMHSSLKDLIRWAQVHLNRGQIDGRRILKASTYDEMWKPAGPGPAHMGLGWFLGTRGTDAVVGHNGSDTGFVADFQLIPARGIAVIVLCNLDHGPYRAIVSAAFDAALGKPSKVVIKPSLAKVIYETLAAQGVDAAVARFRQIRAEQQDVYAVNEWVLNDLGYKLALSGKRDAAMRLLRLNVEEYPGSANVYDSLGEACFRAGDTACALENYRKALEKNPKNGKAAEMVKILGAPGAAH